MTEIMTGLTHDPLPTQHRQHLALGVVERLLDQTIGSDQLLSVLSPMSGDEYLKAGEERNLVGLCGSATCPHNLFCGKYRSKVHSGHIGTTFLEDTSYCSPVCRQNAEDVMARLGNAADALERMLAEGNGQKAIAGMAPATAPMYAAGNQDNPILLHTVQENILDVPATKPLITTGGSPEVQGPGTPTTEDEGPRDRSMGGNLAGAMEVEGYLPRKSVLGKSSLRSDGSDEGSPRNTMRKSLSRKSVTWGDEAGGELEQVRELPEEELKIRNLGIKSVGGTVYKAPTVPPKQMPCIIGDVIERETEPIEPALVPASAPSQPVLVLELEDPASPLEVEKQFGRLKVAEAQELGLTPEQAKAIQDAVHSTQMEEHGTDGEVEAAACVRGFLGGSDIDAAEKERRESLEKDLDWWNTWSAAQASNGERGVRPSRSFSSEEGEAIDMEGLDSDEELYMDEDSDTDAEVDLNNWLRPPPVGFQNDLSSFGLVYKTLDFWLTPVTHHYLSQSANLCTGLVASGSGPAHLQALSALRGIIARALKGLRVVLRFSVSSSLLEAQLDGLLRTFVFPGPLPSLKEVQWELMVLAMVRALAEHRLPALQATLYGPEGGLQLQNTLMSLGSSVEELHALVHLLILPCDD
eukprot:jgi/Botrbrau1/4106/Bobra.152_3s0054.1